MWFSLGGSSFVTNTRMRTLSLSILTILTVASLTTKAQQLCPETFKNRVALSHEASPKKALSVLQKVKAIHTKATKHLYGKVIEVGGDARTLFYLMQGRGGLHQTLTDAFIPHAKQVSEEIYPTDMKKDPRYVKRDKVISMNSVGMKSLLGNPEIVKEISAGNKRPFVFANSSETGYKKRGLAWLSLRIQFEDGFYDFRLQVTLHNTKTEQKDLGQLGINLIHGVMEHVTVPADPISQRKLVESLFDNFKDVEKSIKLNVIEIAKISKDGEVGKNLVDPVSMSKMLFELNAARTLLILPTGDFIDPASYFYGKNFQFFDIKNKADISHAVGKIFSRSDLNGIAVISLKDATPQLMASLQEAGLTLMLSKEDMDAQTIINRNKEHLKILKATVFGPNE